MGIFFRLTAEKLFFNKVLIKIVYEIHTVIGGGVIVARKDQI